MSDSVTTAAAAGTHHRRVGALVGGLVAIVAVAIVALVVIVDTHHSTPAAKAPPVAASSSSGASSASVQQAPASTPVVPALGGIPTVRGAALPKVPTSGSTPVAVPMVPLGNAVWQGMNIQARTSAPATFVLLNGSKQQLVTPTVKDSFHLMVLLADVHTGFAIPYSSVWATIRKGNKIVFDERLWPMISRYMGPHYGNNVSLPSAGLYHLTLLVSPPEAARHVEYKNLWLTPHRVQMTFRWVPSGT
jgi:Fe2+ transport protein